MSNNITTKLNLSGLKSVIKPQRFQDGSMQDCLVIPIDKNNLFKGEKGIYLELTHIPLKEPGKDGRKDTHLVKQNIPKEVYEAMTDEEKQATPIIGNTIVWAGGASNHVGNAAAPVEQKEDDDLPF